VLAAPDVWALPEVPASGYQTDRGTPFFLLTDRSYGSGEVAQARLELPGGSAVAGDQGVDVALYRIPKPLEFLRDQRNLHRVESRALYVGDGAGQTLNYLYDRWTKETRRSWQRILTTPMREKATQRYPELKLGKFPNQPSTSLRPPQFRPIPGLDLVNRFRYPVGYAKPIAPPRT
jgi:uncharacterized protein YfaS (alpha-2-macroglobulin family)